MITNQILLKSLSGLQSITKVGLSLYDVEGKQVVSAEGPDVPAETVRDFAQSPADSQESAGVYFLKINEDGDARFVLACDSSREGAHQTARICVSHIAELLDAYKERDDKGSFFQNLILTIFF